MDLGLHYIGFKLSSKGYRDASWNFDLDQSKSISGYIFTFGIAVSWKSKKQICISKLIMASEFMALMATGAQVEWLRNLLAN